MRNVKTSVDTKAKKLTIEIDLSAPGEDSATGKTTVFATTEGNQSIQGLDPKFKLGLNFYAAKPKG